MTHMMEFTEYVTPDGLVYSFDSEVDHFLLTETGLGMPPIEYITQSAPFQHGESTLDYRLRARTIQLQHRENSCSRTDYWNNRSNWLNFFRPNRSLTGIYRLGTLKKYLPGNVVRAIDVRLEEGPVFAPRELDRWDEYGITETLRFVAPDPTFYDPTLNAVTWTLSPYNSIIFPITFPIVFGTDIIDTDIAVNYTGTWLSYPIITATGPMFGLTITNETTGEFISIPYNIVDSETLTINLGFGSKTVVSSVQGNMIGSVSSDSDLATFHIAPDPEAPGGVNTINATSAGAVAGTSAITLCYYTRYIGI